jgi:peptide/nickel transport system substrate-binding protein
MKKKRIIWLLLSSLMVLSLILASCGEAEEEEEEEVIVPGEEEEVVVPPGEEEEEVPSTGEWWDKWGVPEYGGTFTYTGGEKANWDPYYDGWAELSYETLANQNFAGVDHKILDFKTRFSPLKYNTGRLAESWEVPDNYQTYIFHIRQGVHYHNIPPVNGRELDAYDIEYNFQRILGLGGGEPSLYAARIFLDVESVEATDKWTVVFKSKTPSLRQFRQLLDNHYYGSILPKEAIEMYGDLNDWQRVIGTGPYILVDYVDGASMTSVRNPNYWGYDEHFPENQLPYIDTMKRLIIPDQATARAALRTGKIDYMEMIGWEHMENLLETNPKLQVEKLPWGGAGIMVQHDKKPWSDIRVRKALQMSIDLETIAATHYGGYVDPTPPGLIGVPGYSTPYEEWPQEVKDGYAYNPEGARQLLAEAGYPDGFKCTLAASSFQDIALAEILQSYFADIGVDMEINVMEGPVWNAYVLAGKSPMTMQIGHCYVFPPVEAALIFTPHHLLAPVHNIDDPVFNDLYYGMSETFDEDEQGRLCAEADLYAVANHFSIIILEDWRYTMFQPWVKNYNGEMTINSWGYVFARVWIDSAIKKSMGY